MAGVDHAYQYSVEVKSRFSLFLDDNLNNEDPDLLLSKLQGKRSNKKDKTPVTSIAQEPKKPETIPENEVKSEKTSAKAKVTRMPRLPKTAQAVSAVEPETTDVGETGETNVPPVTRGRGGPRGFSRGFRGRGQGPRPPFQDSMAESAGDLQPQRDTQYEPRGRGRGRGRGFGRGRGSAYTDYREFDRQGQTEGGGMKPVSRRNGVGPVEGDVDAPPEFGDHEPTDGDEPSPMTTEDHDNEEEGGDPAVEEPKCYTLEEYKAMRSASKAALSVGPKSSRKANDGKDVFANMVPLRKADEASDEETEEIEKEQEEEQSFEINVSFTDRHDRGRGRGFGNRGGFERGRGAPGFRGPSSGRPRGGRGTRGGFRGDSRGGGFGRGMAFEHQTARPVLYSDQDFPSLK